MINTYQNDFVVFVCEHKSVKLCLSLKLFKLVFKIEHNLMQYAFCRVH